MAGSTQGLLRFPDRPGVLTEGPAEHAGEDHDEGCYIPSQPVHPLQGIRPQKLRDALDWSVHMSRRSSPDLLRPVENVLPADLREREWQLTVLRTEANLAEGNLSEAEYQLTAILSIEAGINATEALRLGFGSSTQGVIPVIDLSAHALRRPECLPPNYFTPKSGDDRWLPTGGDAIFPLSSACVSLAKQLLDAREAQAGTAPTNLLLTTPIDKGKLRSAVTSHHRLVLSIALADALGIDAAQRAFGDSFGLSTAATFYGSYPAADLAKVIALTNGFASHDLVAAPWRFVAEHVLGSRVRPKVSPYLSVLAQLEGNGKRPRGRPSDKAVFEEWRRRRDRLAILFLLATGHRPSKSMAAMTLYDFLPAYALAVVSDKLTDPAHGTRLVCTGWRFTGELENFVNELKRIARNSACVEAKQLASMILSGNAPLFTGLSAAGPQELVIREVLKKLDALWGDRPNLHRHGLCQFLIQRGVDPELRYFQMGWLTHEHHATSDSAPLPPAKLGPELADYVDEWLETCGWRGRHRAVAPHKILPVTSLQDWLAVRKASIDAQNAALSALRAEVLEAGRALESEVWKRIGVETTRVLLNHDASETSDRPMFNPRVIAPKADGEQHTISQLDVEALLAPFAKDTCSPVERYVASKLLHRALLRTAKTHDVRVYLPEVAVFSRSRIPSPFLPAIGMAVRQVDAFHEALIDRASSIGPVPEGKALADLAAIVLWSIVLHTTCCDAGSASAVVRALSEQTHSGAAPWMVRVPFEQGHVILQGDQAALACRLVRCEGWKSALDSHSKHNFSSLGTFARNLIPDVCATTDSAAQIVRKIAETARVASQVASNGAERLILNGAAKPVTVTALRAATAMDDITVAGDSAAKVSGPRQKDVTHRKNPAHKKARDISHVIRAFDPDFNGLIMDTPAEPPAKRRRQLKSLLAEALAKVGVEPTASRLILEYASHLLEVGGPKSSGGQALSTIYKTIHRIEPMLRGLDANESLEKVDSQLLTALCRMSCESSRRRSSREVLSELRRFFTYVSNQYRVGSPDWDCLYREYGVAVAGGDPALVGNAESLRVFEHLLQNVMSLDGPDWDPAERRYRQICLVAALIAEASGVRPRSVHGLTLADVVLGTENNYIHLRSRGRFASIKTKTSAGFIPLDGEIWNKYEAWFTSWLNVTCVAFPADSLDAIPLFQIPGEAIGVRYEMRRVFGPIGALIRWSTQQPRGRTYWLRKRKVRARHIGVLSRPKARARDMAAALRLGGHALMLTPVAKYVSDPMAYSSRDAGTHSIALRSGAIALTGLTSRQVDRARDASGFGPQTKMARLLRLGESNVTQVELPAPPKFPRYRSDMSWTSLDRVLRDLVKGKDSAWVGARHSAHKVQVESIVQAKNALTARLKIEFGTNSNQLRPPRRGGDSQSWLKFVQANDQRLIPIALDWVAVGGGGALEQGCAVYEAHAADGLRSLAAELGLSTESTELAGGYGTSVIRFVEKDGRTAYGAWQALRWALAVVWIADQRALRK
jgi:hypothetical protein